MKRSLSLTALVAIGIVAMGDVSGAIAESRYTPKPPVVLSPNLTEPWLLQLRPTRRVYRAQPRQERRVYRTQPRQERRYRDYRTEPAVRNRRVKPRRTAAVQARPRVAKRSKRSIDPRYLPTTVEYSSKHKPGTIVIDTNDRYLYLVQGGGTAKRYGVGVGRPGFEWAGAHKLTRKAEWPDWRPPKEMRQRQPNLPKYMPGGPNNPLGARALYLGSTLYRIHGSNQPWTIGHAVSSGCIRMRNEDVMELYERVNVGTKVIVL